MGSQGPFHGRFPSLWLSPGGYLVTFFRLFLRDLQTSEDLVDNFQLSFRCPLASSAIASCFSGPLPWQHTVLCGAWERWVKTIFCGVPLTSRNLVSLCHDNWKKRLLHDGLYLLCCISNVLFTYLGRNRANQWAFCPVRWPSRDCGVRIPFLQVFPTFMSYFLGKVLPSFTDSPCVAFGYAIAQHSTIIHCPFLLSSVSFYKWRKRCWWRWALVEGTHFSARLEKGV